VPARLLLGIICIATFWITGRVLGEFYPFSPLGMFDHPATKAGRLFVRDASGEAREIGRYDAWRCEGPLDFATPADRSCPDAGFSAYDAIVRDHIVSHPAGEADTQNRETVEITRRIFQIPDAHGPVQMTDCPLVRCTARRRPPSLWTPRL
jgi:hypothetical protein